MNSSVAIRIVYSNNFQNTGPSKQLLQIISMNSNVSINGGSISLNNQLLKISSLPISNDDFDIIQATNDFLLIKGFLSKIKNNLFS